MEVDHSAPAEPVARRSRLKRAAAVLAALLLVYVIVAYIVMPWGWKRYVRRHPALEAMPGVTHTAAGIPGDPLNVALIGTEAKVKQAMLKAGWHPADPLSLESDLRIAADSVLKRPYEEAPVSNLFLFGRKEDLAYEQPVGPDPRQRHHVRFWRAEKLDADGRPLWIGAVTFDERVGLSHSTGQITHHISADVDAERNRLFEGLEATGSLAAVFAVDDFHKIREGRNGGGDPWRTDGRLFVGVIGEP